MDKSIVAQGVAERLFATENALDNALSEAALLMHSLTEIRRELRLPAVIVNDSLARVAETMTVMTQARKELLRAHAAMDVAQKQIGVKTVAFGAIPKPKDPERPGGVEQRFAIAG